MVSGVFLYWFEGVDPRKMNMPSLAGVGDRFRSVSDDDADEWSELVGPGLEFPSSSSGSREAGEKVRGVKLAEDVEDDWVAAEPAAGSSSE